MELTADLEFELEKATPEEGTSSDIAPPSTPDKVFKFSDHVHKDRHIFLGHAYLSMLNMADCDRREFYSFDFNPVRLPSLNKVSLSLDITPPPRRFNENINTYVDTRKRVRMFHFIDDYDHYRTGLSPQPNVEKKSSLGSGLLKTSQIRKPETSREGQSQLPPLKKSGGLENTAFPFKLHREGTFNFSSGMPTRFAIKPVNLWRQKTDTQLYGRKLNLQRRAKVSSE